MNEKKYVKIRRNARRRRWRRNRGKIIALAVILVLVLAGGGALWHFQGDRLLSAFSGRGAENREDSAQSEGGTEESGETEKGGEEEEPETQLPTTIVFTGDVLLSSYVQNNYDSGGISGVLDQELLNLLNGADITMINNEFPFSTRGTQAEDKQYTFRVNPSYVTALQEMGVDVAGLANNHVLDYGTEALEDTFTTLENAGIAYTGAGRSYEDACRLIRFEKNGKSFGFLAASRVIPEVSWNVENGAPGVFCTYDTTHLVEEIKKAKQQCDYVFVAVHWGVEHTDELTDYQPVIAHQLIDGGGGRRHRIPSPCAPGDGVLPGKADLLQPRQFYLQPGDRADRGGGDHGNPGERDADPACSRLPPRMLTPTAWPGRRPRRFSDTWMICRGRQRWMKTVW